MSRLTPEQLGRLKEKYRGDDDDFGGLIVFCGPRDQESLRVCKELSHFFVNGFPAVYIGGADNHQRGDK